MHEEKVAAFRQAVEAGDADTVLATLAPQVSFNNPVMFRPLNGLETLSFVVPRLLEVWQNLRYVAELHGDELIGLVFDARVGDRKVRGIDLLHFNGDGLIDEITVMVRPMSGLKALASEMEAVLAAANRAVDARLA